MQFRAVNLENTGSDRETQQKNLNAHGAERFEHYEKAGMIGFLRETTVVWEYNVIQLYGNSKMLTEQLNQMATERWVHYLIVGTLGYFKRPVIEIPVSLPEINAEPVPALPISDTRMDRTGIPQMVARNGNGKIHARNGRR